MRIVVRDRYGHDVVAWAVPEDFVDLGRWSRVETGLDDRDVMYSVVIERETNTATNDPLSTPGTNPGTER